MKQLVFGIGLALAVSTAHADKATQKNVKVQQARYSAALTVDKLAHTAYAISDCQYELRADTPMIPASTLKILTALVALEYWGEDHHFETRFYLTKDKTLWIKGFGDPYLLTEEITNMAATLKAVMPKNIKRIALDTSYFQSDILIDGRSDTDNPYDAPPGALAANLNTIHLDKTGTAIKTGEAITPITSVALKVARQLPDGNQRVNVRDSQNGARHFAEILAQRLGYRAVKVSHGILPKDARLLLNYENRHSLIEVIQPMLQYSSNFIANQLFLALGAEIKGGPASVEKSAAVFNERLQEIPGMETAHVVEGSGLSRANRLSANQLLTLLELFKPWKSLLPGRGEGIHAKTGTLNGTRTLAGYLIDPKQEWRPFAVMINQNANPKLRYQTANQLLQRLPGCSKQIDLKQASAHQVIPEVVNRH